jgi:hypothetical protein
MDTLVGATIDGESGVLLPCRVATGAGTIAENAIFCFMFSGRYMTSIDSGVTSRTRYVPSITSPGATA